MMDSLVRLQGLHADLQAFSETRLVHIDRLCQELEDSVEEFRKLLDKPTPTAAENQAYNAGKVSVDGQDYGISEEFRHLSRAISTALDLDVVEAGKLLVQGGHEDGQADGYIVTDAVNRFHDHRDLILQSLRIVLDEASKLDHDENIRSLLKNVVGKTLNIIDGPPSNGSAFIAKCLKAMEEVEISLAKIVEQIQSKAILSQLRGPESYATLEFQKSSLFKQHEALGAILRLLFKGNYAVSDDLQKLQVVIKRWQRIDILWIHYLPAFSAAFRQYGSPEGSVTVEDAQSLDRALLALTTENSNSQSRPLQAVLDLWWTVEFSGWSRESPAVDNETQKRTQIVKTALEDHALECLLLTCSTSDTEMWKHPARHELITLLVGNIGNISLDSDQQTSAFFNTMLMESLEAFAEAWITNMPDSIRQLKHQEDDERLLRITSEHDPLSPPAPREDLGRLHLESFLILIAYAFEQRIDAAEQFWEDLDGNMYGFLQWSSKRQTVPRVSAFCEMLCAISEGSENASAAHKFLLDEAIVVPSSRARRVPTMNYAQIFAELELYARRVHERQPVPQPRTAQAVALPTLNEVESPVMLACYLRLLAHLSRHNAPTRDYILAHAGYDFPRTLLMLASGPIPTYLRATVFRTIEALLTDKNVELSMDIWKAVDEWTSKNHDTKSAPKPGSPPERSMAYMQATLSSTASSFDQYDAFVELIRTLVIPTIPSFIDGTSVPFPNDLGSSYRVPGISPYVDFVCGDIFRKRYRELGDETQAMLCAYHCLDFIAICLESFNENYVAMLDKSAKQSQNLNNSKQDLYYAQNHPFARVMQWLYGSDMNRATIKLLHGRMSELQSCLPDAPVVATMMRGIDVINLVLNLQPTYLDVVRPLLKESEKLKNANFTGFATFEENIAATPEIILDLCQYANTPHLPLCMRSLALLQKLTGSPKLNSEFVAGAASSGRRLIDMLGPSSTSVLAYMAESFATSLHLDLRELEDGFEAPGYLLKDGQLAFLNACLSLQTDLPSIAHLVLGYGRIGSRLTITEQMDDASSLFNSIVRLVIDYPDGQDGDLVSWLVHIKCAGLRVLQSLWSAPISSDITMSQLRRLEFLSAQFVSQSILSHTTIWDGHRISDPEFWYTTSAEALTEFYVIRACIYDYTTREIQAIGSEQLISIQKQVISTLQGKTIGGDGVQARHCTIFDLFDFADLDTSADLRMPDLNYFATVNYDGYMVGLNNEAAQLYDVAVIRELLQVVQNDILEPQSQSAGNKPVDQDALAFEIDLIIGCLEARNRWTSAHVARSQALHNYVDMIISAVESVSLEAESTAQFSLHVLQIILPKLDTFVAEEVPEALELARAADALLLALSRTTHITTHDRMADMITERLFQLFRICLEGISLASSNLDLRTTLYSICSQYLTRILDAGVSQNEVHRKARGNSMDCVRSASQRLVVILSDDAEDGSDTCRLNALNLLSMLASLARSEQSHLIVESLAKHNLLEIVLEPLRSIVSDFASTSIKHRAYFLTLFEARMFLLLQISRTRTGAVTVLESGLIQACRDSMIFRADPDLGMDLDTTSSVISNSRADTNSTSSSASARTSAINNYFCLLSNTLRVLLSAFIARGPENEQLQYQVRTFLSDHRANMVSVFKKAAGVNGSVADQKLKALIEESVRCYVGLESGVGFIDYEDETALDGSIRTNGFS